MQLYVCQFNDSGWYYICFAESRRKAVTKFKLDGECRSDIEKYQYKVGLLNIIRPDVTDDSMIMRNIKSKTSIRLVHSDRID